MTQGPLGGGCPDVLAVLSGEARWCVITGDCLEIMLSMPDGCVDHVITDPPYSRHVHQNVRSSKRDGLPYTVDLGFGHLTAATRRAVARHAARLMRRWGLFFSDADSAWLWRLSLRATGLRFKRTCEWRRIGGAPQFTGDRPAQAFEAITAVHRAGRSRWNGGGKQGQYTHPVVANRGGQRDSRWHPTQKPIGLMLDLVADFTDPGDVVLDPFCGSGTTGVACLRLGRRFVGIEMDKDHAETARERLRAEQSSSTLAARRAGQTSLFGGGC